jgi:DNA-binding IclR family transcriptional regulator
MAEATGETALYLRRVNDAAVCLAIAESDHPISISFRPGHLMPLHGGAAAKVLLAGYGDAKREQYIERLRPPLSKSARVALETDLDDIRSSGFAESSGEVDEGIWAAAAPVHLFGTLVGAITVVAPDYRLGSQQKQNIREAVRAGANEFEHLLGA